jgi:hypothetical protein
VGAFVEDQLLGHHVIACLGRRRERGQARQPRRGPNEARRLDGAEGRPRIPRRDGPAQWLNAFGAAAA